MTDNNSTPETSQPDAGNKNGLKIAVFSVLVVLVTAGLVYLQSRDRDHTPTDIPFPYDAAEVIARLSENALALNHKTPIMVDNSTRLDEILVDGNTITYRNTIMNLTAEDRVRDDVFKMTLTRFLAQKYCGDMKMSKGLKAGMIYDHEYSGRDGTLLFTAAISLKDCSE